MRERAWFNVTGLLVLVALLAGCGMSAREKALRATFVTINSARDGFTKFDAQKQQQIVDDAKTLEEGQAALAAYRKDREKVLGLFEGVYQAFAAAVLAEDDTKTKAGMLAILDKLKEALTALQKSGAL
jgi:hypothetical protein